jgi:4-carboxymuconolactone decarboxylase
MTDPKATPRFDAVPESAMTQAHRDAVAEFLKTPRGGMGGPFAPMLHSPEFFNRAQRLGEYLRFAGAIPKKLREFAILVAARHWTQRYEWYIHAPLAEQEGLDSAVIDALANNRRPAKMNANETTIYEFCTQLHRTQEVDDATYAAALKMLGTPGIVDLCGICGYYSMLAMVMNVARTQLPEGANAPF